MLPYALQFDASGIAVVSPPSPSPGEASASPPASTTVESFVTLYDKGPLDIVVVLVFLFAFLRIRRLAERNVFLPLAVRWGVLAPPRKRKSASTIPRPLPTIALKFSEQFWLMINHSLSLTFGLALLVHQPYYENFFSLTAFRTPQDGLKHVWLGYSKGHRYLTAAAKGYYLLEIAYWGHLLVDELRNYMAVKAWERYLAAERQYEKAKAKLEREEAKANGGLATPPGTPVRVPASKAATLVPPKKVEPPNGRRKVKKDAMELFLHHIVTVSLVVISYSMHYTRIGHVILVLFDVADVALSFAKVLKYIPTMPSMVTDTIFGLFVVSWLYTRHLLFCFRVIPSLAFDAHELIEDKEFKGFSEGHWYSFFVQRLCLAFLIVLEGLMIFWFWLILKVVGKVLTGGGADDVRSDDEEEVDLGEKDD
ncbi:TLC domain-containing protein [Cladochytrium replicatum]|nr:TLC domain-containing protein [Cladochytrium replicatum]